MGHTSAIGRRVALAAAAGLAVASAGAALAAPATAATGKIREAGTTEVVKNSYVVVLKDTAALRSRGVAGSASELVERYGGRTGRTYSHALKGFEVSVGATAAGRLAADPAVAYVQRNGIYTTQATQSPTPSYGLDRIDQRNLPLSNSYTYATTASNVHAYIIDTGIRLTHADFGGRATQRPRHGRQRQRRDRLQRPRHARRRHGRRHGVRRRQGRPARRRPRAQLPGLAARRRRSSPASTG